jgi:hypothetical protein
MTGTPAQANGQYANGAPYIGRPCGYQQITPTVSTALTPPASAKYAVFSAEVQAIRIRDDGTAPTTSVGWLLPVNTPFTYTGNLNAVLAINAVAGGILNVLYYY